MAIGSVMRAGLTQRELSLFAAAFASMKTSERNFDWDKFTQLAGYKTVESARVCFRPAIKKLDNFVNNGCPGGDDDETPAPKPAKAPRTKRNTGAAKSAPKCRAVKRKLEAEDFEEEQKPAIGAVKSECVDGASLLTVGEPRPSTSFNVGNEQSGGAEKPGQPSIPMFKSGSGPADTYTGSSPAACGLVPAPGSTATNEPANGSATTAPKRHCSASRQAEEKHESSESLVAPSLKLEDMKQEEDGPTEQLIREAAPKTEDADEQNPVVVEIASLLRAGSAHHASSDDAKSVLGGTAPSMSARTIASLDTDVSVPFEDQNFSYGDALDVGFEGFDGQEDMI